MHLLISMLLVFSLMGLLAISKAYVNVALNKPAYLQYPLIPGDDRYDVSNAVDGRKSDLRWGGGQCAVSKYKQTATLWVNLTSIHRIHHITIYFRTENNDFWFRKYITADLLGFSVYFSNTTDRLQGTLCFKDNNFTKDTLPSVFTKNCFVHGQYVINYNERLPGVVYPGGYYWSVSIQLCEVEVYGCPVAGCYGSNNTFPCPDVNCQNCHMETGTCQGCKPGYMYQGHRCELECDKGWYGIGCNETCGHCRNESQCSNDNGTCEAGCDAGFTGDQCKTCEYTGICYGYNSTTH
eukprot:XP_019926961.1 PREDICTED: uncharacterized protein LOC109619993 [Crassostrea gigas]